MQSITSSTRKSPAPFIAKIDAAGLEALGPSAVGRLDERMVAPEAVAQWRQIREGEVDAELQAFVLRLAKGDFPREVLCPYTHDKEGHLRCLLEDASNKSREWFVQKIIEVVTSSITRDPSKLPWIEAALDCARRFEVTVHQQQIEAALSQVLTAVFTMESYIRALLAAPYATRALTKLATRQKQDPSPTAREAYAICVLLGDSWFDWPSPPPAELHRIALRHSTAHGGTELVAAFLKRVTPSNGELQSADLVPLEQEMLERFGKRVLSEVGKPVNGYPTELLYLSLFKTYDQRCTRVAGLSHDARQGIVVAYLRNCQFETARVLEEKLNVAIGTFAKEIGDVAVSQHDLAVAEELTARFGYRPTQELEESLMEKLRKTFDQLAKSSDSRKACDAWLRLNAFKHYMDNGSALGALGARDPVENIAPNYQGKVMLFDVGGVQVVRGHYHSKDLDHESIMKGFDRELANRGLGNLNYCHRGGGKIVISEQEKSIAIYPGSRDFGPRDDAGCESLVQELKRLLGQHFPGYTFS